MMATRVPLMFIQGEGPNKLARHFRGVSTRVQNFFPTLEDDVLQAGIGIPANIYSALVIINTVVIFTFLFTLLFSINLFAKDVPFFEAFTQSFLPAGGFFLVFFFVLFRYPGILAAKKAAEMEKNLIFALKDLLLQISSGISLYNGIVHISKSGYGTVSEEFEKVAQAIASGTPMEEALDKMSSETKSEFLKRTVWQLINALKAGASLKGALRTIINGLISTQHTKIRSYAQELNLWSLMYMMFSVAIPTIGAVMLVILSSFAGFGVTPALFIIFLLSTLIIQFILIGLIKARRPVVNL